jgi:hypothetical protein
MKVSTPQKTNSKSNPQHYCASLCTAAPLQAGLQQELGQTMNLMGDVTVALARNAAEAFVSAQKQLDDVLPGPPLQQVLSNLT